MKVNTIYTAIDKMTATHQKIEQSNSKMAKKVEANLARVERKMRAVGDRAMKIGRQGFLTATAIAAPMILFANEAAKFEKSMSNVNTLLDSNIEDIDKMGEHILDMSTKLPVPIEELTSSLYDIRSAGIDAAHQFEVLETAAKLGVAGLSTTSEATNILTSAMNAFAHEGKSAEEIADILFKTVKFGKTNIAEMTAGFGAVTSSAIAAEVSISELSAATGALTAVGVPTAQSQTMLKALFAEMVRDTGKLAQGYKKLTGGQIEIDTTTNGFHETLTNLWEAVGKNEVAFKNLFSSQEAGGAALSLVTNASEAYLSTLGAMEGGTNALTDAFDKQAKTTSAQFQVAKNQFQALAITLGQALLPVVNDLMEAIAPMVKSFSRWARRNKALLGTIFKVAAAVAGLALAVSGIAFAVGIATKAIVIAKGVLMLWKVAVGVVTAVQWLWNAAMLANPIGLVIVAVAALAAGVYALSRAFKTSTAEQRINNEIQERVIDKTADQIAESRVLFEQLRRLEEGTQAYNDVLQKIDEIQPGIIEKYNLQTKALENIAAAEAELTKNIIKRAETEARMELLGEKIKEQQKLQLEMEEAGGITYWDALTGIGAVQKMWDARQMQGLDEEINVLAEQVTQDELQKVNPGMTTREELLQKKESVEKMGITISAENLPDWIKVQVQPGDFGGAMPNVSPTN